MMNEEITSDLQLEAGEETDRGKETLGDAGKKITEELETGSVEKTRTPKEDVKIFKQEDVNNIVAKETKKATEKMLKQLGMKDFDGAKEGLEKFRKWQDEQKTEAEKQAERLKKLETDNADLAGENSDLKAQLAAMKQGVLSDSVEDVVVLAKRLVDDDTTMDDAIEKVLEKYPHFTKVEPEEETEEKPPTFSKGKHQKKPKTDADVWLEAFRPTGVSKDT